MRIVRLPRGLVGGFVYLIPASVSSFHADEDYDRMTVVCVGGHRHLVDLTAENVAQVLIDDRSAFEVGAFCSSPG